MDALLQLRCIASHIQVKHGSSIFDSSNLTHADRRSPGLMTSIGERLSQRHSNVHNIGRDRLHLYSVLELVAAA
jgi:hypothetical protein